MTLGVNPCTFEELPFDKDGPPLNAWGAWGKDNELGRLNLIDAAAVRRGRDEIKEGIAINLNLPLNGRPLHGDRILFSREMLVRDETGKYASNDDVVHINTQSSTQWDGFRHFCYQDFPKGSGRRRYMHDMPKSEAIDLQCHRFGIQIYADHPITSRGVLLDVARHFKLHPEAKQKYFPEGYDLFNSRTVISVPLLEEVAKAEKVTFKGGDVLVVRMGFTEAWLDHCSKTTWEEYKDWLKVRKGNVGVDHTVEMMKFHWDNGIAAVACDSVGYETFSQPMGTDLQIHEVFLGGWGLPIGEMFDLRKLAAECDRLNRWTFFFASMPLNIPGGIASPPNAQAIL